MPSTPRPDEPHAPRAGAPSVVLLGGPRRVLSSCPRPGIDSMKSPKQKPTEPMTSAEIAEHLAGSKRHVFDAAVQRAVREAIELNEFLDEQKRRRESEPRRPAPKKRRAS